jgi:hypothetical protein
MRYTKYITAALMSAILVVAGCGLNTVIPAEAPQLVVQGFLVPGTFADSIVLKITVDPSLYYQDYELYEDREKTYVSGATITITHNGTAYALTEWVQPEYSGTYGTHGLVVQEGQTYDLDVRYTETGTGKQHHLTASTTVPFIPQNTRYELTQGQIFRQRRFGIADDNIDTLIFPRQLADPDKYPPYGDDVTRPFGLWWDPSPNAAGYLVGVTAQDTAGTGMLRRSDYKDWLDGDYATNRDRRMMQSLGLGAHRDTTHVDNYWFLYRYRGDFMIGVIAVDTNYWDFFRSSGGGDVGGSGSDWDEGTIFHVSGGLGVFGSYAQSEELKTNIVREYDPVSMTLTLVD